MYSSWTVRRSSGAQFLTRKMNTLTSCILGHKWVIISNIILHIRVYKNIFQSDCPTLRCTLKYCPIRCCLTTTIHTSPTRQYDFMEHTFGNICRRMWSHGFKACLSIWRHAVKRLAAGTANLASRGLVCTVRWPPKRPKEGNGRQISPKTTLIWTSPSHSTPAPNGELLRSPQLPYRHKHFLV